MSTPIATPRRKGAGLPRGRYDLSRDDWAELLGNEPKFRLDQVWDGLYGQQRPLEELTNVSKQLRERLSADIPTSLAEVTTSISDNGATQKFLWRLQSGELIETVLMEYPDRTTVCISTQAGCAMACSFCATGQAGFDRQLTVGEIVEQFVRAQQAAWKRNPDRRISNLVFMGMGEPLANFKNMWGAVERLHGDIGLGARHLTVSTVGIIPGIQQLAAAPLPVNLAVSLHAANDTLRNELVPINERYPLDDLFGACQDYVKQTRRRISIEWAMISHVNDALSDAQELARFAKPLGAHVNLIPLNPTPGYAVIGSSRNRIYTFRDELRSRGVNVTIRDTRGTEIDAACGQLRAGFEPANS